MKRIPVLLVLSVLLFWSCGNDDDNGLPGADFELRLDGRNDGAPVIQAGTYEDAVRFPASTMQRYQGDFLDEITFYMADVPDVTYVIVYEGGNEEDDEVYSVNISNSVRANQWNSHVLINPIRLSGEELWLAIYVSHPDEDLATVGCDPGPARTGGDWQLSYAANRWESLYFWENGNVDINWNIRGNVSN